MKLSPLTHEDTLRLNAILGSAPDLTEGEILKFSDAVLARAEVNKNGDGIDEVGLSDLAKTLPLMPLDDEHVSDRVIGFFTSASVQDAALFTDGIIYAARFPEIVQDIVAGRKHLSVEAYGAQARCSVCGAVFESPKDYCSHLTGRPDNGAVRWLSGLRAIGGGAVRRNAGTDTTFDRNGFVLLASLADDVSPVDGSVSDNTNATVPGVVQDEQGDEQKMDELEKTLVETKALLAQREQELHAAQEREHALEVAHQAELDSLRRTFARKTEMIAAGFAEDAVNALEAKLAAVDEDVFNLLLQTGQQARSVPVGSNVVEAAAEQTPAKEHAVMASNRVVDNANPFVIFVK